MWSFGVLSFFFFPLGGGFALLCFAYSFVCLFLFFFLPSAHIASLRFRRTHPVRLFLVVLKGNPEGTPFFEGVQAKKTDDPCSLCGMAGPCREMSKDEMFGSQD